MSELTEKQIAFVHHITTTRGAIGNASEAARLAGYSHSHAKEIGYRLLHKPHVRDAIFEANQAEIGGELAAKAVQVLQDILNDEDAPMKLRLDAARTVLDRAGVIAPKAEEPQGRSDRAMSELSVPELQQRLDDLKRKREEENSNAPVH